MPYIYENTNTLKVECVEISDGSTFQTLTFDANCSSDFDDKLVVYENWNYELMFDDIGSRMIITASILNNSNINTQADIYALLHCINLVRSGLYKFIVWPNWDDNMNVWTLDSFECAVIKKYDTKKIHKFVKAGNDIIVKFIELIPDTNYVPKIPDNNTIIPPFVPANIV